MADTGPSGDTDEPLPLPTVAGWAAVGLAVGREVHAGHQSRIFRSTLRGHPIVVKLTDSRFVDGFFEQRIRLSSSLGEISGSVVGPLPIGERLITRLDSWLAVAYPFVNGVTPALGVEADVRRMGSTLAGLHRSMAQVDAIDLPRVAALRNGATTDDRDGFGNEQLLHGDYSHVNVLHAGGRLRVFDLDDCGHGPVEFEVGNTLYMVLFDASIRDAMDGYERFRIWFVDAYRTASGTAVADSTLDVAIRLRIEALARWIDKPEQAPIGIRMAGSSWLDTLRTFVESRLRV